MKILNVRRGHATNSSSTHSLILAGSADGNSEITGPEVYEFGCNYFLQRTYSEKINYFAQTLYDCASNQFGPQIASIIVRELFGRSSFSPEGYVDHQSRIFIPVDYDGHMCLDFWEDYADIIAKDRTVQIMGGSDNDDLDIGVSHPVYKFMPERKCVCRKQDDVWAIFNPETGIKMHISMSDVNYRPSTPELVDLKITDYCDRGCKFCYQNSTVKGKHADMNSLHPYIWALSRAQVFEIALGGGEPTKHPEFATILDYSWLIPSISFSTASCDWYSDEKITDSVSKNVKAYAHSIHSAEELDLVKKYCSNARAKYGHNNWPVMHIQYVLDAYPIELFEYILDQVPWGSNITLLGYKSVGRGGTAPFSHDNWRDVYDKYYRSRAPRIGIDTAFANKYQHTLQDIPEEMYYLEEGRFSMYIDAVEHAYAESSFAPAELFSSTVANTRKDGSIVIGKVQDMFQSLRKK